MKLPFHSLQWTEDFSSPHIEKYIKTTQSLIYRTLAVATVAWCWRYVSIHCSKY